MWYKARKMSAKREKPMRIIAFVTGHILSYLSRYIDCLCYWSYPQLSFSLYRLSLLLVISSIIFLVISIVFVTGHILNYLSRYIDCLCYWSYPQLSFSLYRLSLLLVISSIIFLVISIVFVTGHILNYLSRYIGRLEVHSGIFNIYSKKIFETGRIQCVHIVVRMEHIQMHACVHP